MDERIWTPEARERLKGDVLAARHALIDEGIYPSLAALRDRLGVSDKAIRRARHALIAAGAIDDDYRGPSLREQRRQANSAMVLQRRQARAEKKARMLAYLLDHASRGLYPSVRDLREGFGHEGLVRELRDELRDEGLYRLPPGRGVGLRPSESLNGSSPASRKAIEANILEIRAQKEARGEPCVMPAHPVEIQRSHDFRVRENRR